MKLATLKDGSRHGLLVLVSADLRSAMPAPGYKFLQAALDDWAHAQPLLREAYEKLEAGRIAGTMAFNAFDCSAPLPRAYQWANSCAYVHQLEQAYQAQGAQMPAHLWSTPLISQIGSDCFLAPTEAIPLPHADWGLDLEAGIAVITDDVPQGITAEAARQKIRLILLVNALSFRNSMQDDLSKGFVSAQCKPPSTFSPVAVTPDQLGAAWQAGRVHLPLLSYVNGQLLGKPEAGRDMVFDFGQLIAHAAQTRPLGAGSIIGSGPVSNQGPNGGPTLPISAGGIGYSSLAALRQAQVLYQAQASTPYLQAGNDVRIEMLDRKGCSIFGAMTQQIQG